MAKEKKWSEMTDEERAQMDDAEALDNFYGEIAGEDDK